MPLSGTGVAVRHRVRLARALAGSPAVLLVEHPTAGLEPHEIAPLADDLIRVARTRALAVVVLAAETAQVSPFARRVLTLNGATGELSDQPKGFLGKIFGSRT
jgi:ABC-type transporter Mla maintaining outer membrane lipid asymmetry ATPase subunit MlaF